ncbi:glycosyltransferase [Candidatus Collierbacteria bacterium]|nr:glycosyltransferase [Candidatus Collierbacteria bacterium]
MKQTIVFTGGHHNSALVVAKELKKEGFQIAWMGHKFNFSNKSLSAEYQEVTAEKIPFYELKTGKFYRQKNPIEYGKILFGLIQAFVYLNKIRPVLIVSFGGFMAVPAVIAGWLLRIPSVTHEQTVVAGWANKAISPFVKKILLTHESSLKNFPKKKSVVVGLPLRPELFDPKLKQKFDPKLLYISCGKQGSHTINQALFPLIGELVKKFTVVHQTGASGPSRDADRARRIKESLGDLSNRYTYAPYFFATDAATYLQSAEVVISRAGAHLTYELSLLQKRAIFIPIPWVSHNEQLKNANLAAKKTPAIILLEKDLSRETLMAAIESVLAKPLRKTTKEDIEAGLNATRKIIDIIHGILKK